MTLVSSGIVRTACGLPDARRSACFLGACSPQRSPHKFDLMAVCRRRVLPTVSTENSPLCDIVHGNRLQRLANGPNTVVREIKWKNTVV